MKRIKGNTLDILCGLLLTLVTAFLLFLGKVPHAQVFMILIMCALYVFGSFLSAFTSVLVIIGYNYYILTDQWKSLILSTGSFINMLAFIVAIVLVFSLMEYYKHHHEKLEQDLQAENEDYKRRIEGLENALEYDTLTMLKSRQAYRKDFDQLLKKETLVVYVDVDDFKNFNDHYGHRTGDFVLSSVAHQLIDAFGQEHCYRYGGDEFILVLPHQDDHLVTSALQAIQDKLKSFTYRDDPLEISFTAGYCYGKANTSHTMRQIMKQADLNLYYSKARRKGSIFGSEYYPMEFEAD